MNACYLCGSTVNTAYCSLCGKWFCASCRTNYPARVAAAMREPVHTARQLGAGLTGLLRRAGL